MYLNLSILNLVINKETPTPFLKLCSKPLHTYLNFACLNYLNPFLITIITVTEELLIFRYVKV
jgi:hypothetical protein